MRWPPDRWSASPTGSKTDHFSLKGPLSQLVEQIQSLYPDLPNARWVALRLLDGDSRIVEAVLEGELGKLTPRPLPWLQALSRSKAI